MSTEEARPAQSTRDLIDRCVSGDDQEAWSELVERFDADLRRAVRAIVRRGRRRSVELEQDLVQETYYRLLERGAWRLRRCRERSEPAIRAFLMRVARNVAIDSLRIRGAQKRGRRQLVESARRPLRLEIRPDPAPSSEEKLILREERRKFLDCCRRVAGKRSPERNLRILELAFLGGLTSREIAVKLDPPLTTTCVDTLLCRARKKLRERGYRLGGRRATMS